MLRRPIMLLVVAIGVAACAQRAGAPLEPSPIADESRELAADAQVVHALNRLAFGPRPGDVARVRAMGVDRWIAQQLRPEQLADDSLAHFLSGYTTLDRSAAELAGDYAPPALLLARRRLRGDTSSMSRGDSVQVRDAARRANTVIAELASSRVARAVASERQLDEVMVDFWENHFNVFAGKGAPERYFLTEYDRDVIRPHALGKFRDLLGAVAKSPAMLFYLDNWQSRADSGQPVLRASASRGARRGAVPSGRRRPFRRPAMRFGDSAQRATRVTPPAAGRRPSGLNENYGRELLELHTLGVDGGYSQQDVIAAARALTGWSIQDPRRGGGFVFRPEWHDAGTKVVLGHTLARGRGIEDGEELLDLLARHPATARFIATKLVRRFVSDTPPPALVDRAAATFTRTDGDIREVVRTVITSPEFFSLAAYRSKVKSPFEVVTSALRAVNASPDRSPRSAQLVARMGQPIFGHQAPNGWPESGDAWMNTGAILNRINFGMAVAAGRVPGTSGDRWPFAPTLASASRADQVDAIVAAILGGDISPDTRAILLSGDHPLLAAAARQDSVPDDDSTDVMVVAGDSSASSMPASDGPMRARRARTPGERRGVGSGPAFGRLPELNGLAQVLGLALGAPEFQRR